MTRIEPGLAGATVRSSDEIQVINGEPRRGLHLTVTEEQFEQYRSGYRCLSCHSVQEQAFPEVCEQVWKDGGGCGYPIRARQREELEWHFRGREELWPMGRVDHEMEGWKPRTGIWLPGDDNG